MKPMTQEAYKEGIKAIDLTAKTEKSKVMIEYASSNNPHKKGDIVTDHSGSIIIEKIFKLFSTKYSSFICNCSLFKT